MKKSNKKKEKSFFMFCIETGFACLASFIVLGLAIYGMTWLVGQQSVGASFLPICATLGVTFFMICFFTGLADWIKIKFKK